MFGSARQRVSGLAVAVIAIASVGFTVGAGRTHAGTVFQGACTVQNVRLNWGAPLSTTPFSIHYTMTGTATCTQDDSGTTNRTLHLYASGDAIVSCTEIFTDNGTGNWSIDGSGGGPVDLNGAGPMEAQTWTLVDSAFAGGFDASVTLTWKVQADGLNCRNGGMNRTDFIGAVVYTDPTV